MSLIKKEFLCLLLLLFLVSFEAHKFKFPKNQKKRISAEDIEKLILPERQGENFKIQPGFKKLALDLKEILRQKLNINLDEPSGNFDKNVFQAKQDLQNSKLKVDQRIEKINEFLQPSATNKEKK
jgi:hypothetical protein